MILTYVKTSLSPMDYMNNNPIWGNHLACIYKTNEIFETYEIAMYYLTFTGY